MHNGYIKPRLNLNIKESKKRVLTSKKNLKHHKADYFKAFVTENLTKKEHKFFIQRLEQARKDNKIGNHLTTDRRSSNDKIRDYISDTGYILPEPAINIIGNPWEHNTRFVSDSMN